MYSQLQRAGGLARLLQNKDQREIDHALEVTRACIHAQTHATAVGMSAVTTVALGQQALEQLAPAASGRLDFIATRHALAVADTLDDLHYRLRRL